jgi:hypothetical protein
MEATQAASLCNCQRLPIAPSRNQEEAARRQAMEKILPAVPLRRRKESKQKAELP